MLGNTATEPYCGEKQVLIQSCPKLRLAVWARTQQPCDGTNCSEHQENVIAVASALLDIMGRIISDLLATLQPALMRATQAPSHLRTSALQRLRNASALLRQSKHPRPGRIRALQPKGRV